MPAPAARSGTEDERSAPSVWSVHIASADYRFDLSGIRAAPFVGQMDEGVGFETTPGRIVLRAHDHRPESRKIGGHLNELAISRTRLVHPLKGFLFTPDGQALTPTYTNKSREAADGTKNRKRYRYYVSQQAIRQGYGTSPLKTISANLLEDAIRRMLVHALPYLSEHVPAGELSSGEIHHRLSMHASHLASTDTPVEFARWMEKANAKIIIGTGLVFIHVSCERLAALVGAPPNDAMELPRPTMSVPTEVTREGDLVSIKATICFKPRRGRSEIIDGRTGGEITARRTSPNLSLIQTIAQAEFWRSEIDRRPDDALQEITGQHGIMPTYVRRLLNAAYLAPAIKRAVFQGTQPAGMQVQDLIAPRSLDWRVQMVELGFGSDVAPA